MPMRRDGRLWSTLAALLLYAAVLLPAVLAACRSGSATPAATPAAGGGAVPALAGEVPGDLVAAIDRAVIVRTAAGERREVAKTVSTTPLYPAHPAWSPDGKTIAYVQRAFSTGLPGADWGDDIYLVPAAGGTPRLLRKHTQAGDQVQGLAWTPDGAGLLFGHVITVFRDGQVFGLRSEIARIEVAGGAERALTDNGFHPSLSRDGKRMAYLGLRDLQSELAVADGDGGSPRVLIPADTFVAIMFPRISPDGTAIVFAAANPRSQSREHRGGGLLDTALAWLRPATASASASASATHGIPMDIWRVDVATGQRRMIAPLAEDEPMPVWSADGKSLIVFATGGLYRMGADGSSLLRLGEGAFGGQIDLR